MKAKTIKMTWNGFNDLLKSCEKKALESVPAAHSRILAETKHKLAKEYILGNAAEEAEISAGDWIVFTAQHNLGTIKYPHMIEIVECGKVQKPCNKICITTDGSRPTAERILAVCKAKE